MNVSYMLNMLKFSTAKKFGTIGLNLIQCVEVVTFLNHTSLGLINVIRS